MGDLVWMKNYGPGDNLLPEVTQPEHAEPAPVVPASDVLAEAALSLEASSSLDSLDIHCPIQLLLHLGVL